MEKDILYAKKPLRIGFPYMLGIIENIKRGETCNIITVRYDDIPDKEFKVYGVRS